MCFVFCSCFFSCYFRVLATMTPPPLTAPPSTIPYVQQQHGKIISEVGRTKKRSSGKGQKEGLESEKGRTDKSDPRGEMEQERGETIIMIYSSADGRKEWKTWSLITGSTLIRAFLFVKCRKCPKRLLIVEEVVQNNATLNNIRFTVLLLSVAIFHAIHRN